VAPAACATIWREMTAGHADSARIAQQRIVLVGEALGKTNGVARLKAALRLQGFDHGAPRLPVPPLDEAELPALRALLDAARLLPTGLPA